MGRRLREQARENREIAAETEDSGGMARCPYYRGVGSCLGGCYTEPSCVTDEPITGWPKPWILGDARRRTHRRRYAPGRWFW